MKDLYRIRSEAQWEELLEEVANQTLMTAMLTDREGAILKIRGNRNPLCSRIRQSRDSQSAICGQTNTAMLEEARTTLSPVVEECEAGLLRIAVPIVSMARKSGVNTPQSMRLISDQGSMVEIDTSAKNRHTAAIATNTKLMVTLGE